MKHHGIPNSPDRILRQGLFSLVALLLFLLIGGLFWLLNIRDAAPPALDLETSQHSRQRLDPFLEEHERASAYAALREYIDTTLRNEDRVRAIYCRDSRHRIVGRYFEFRGEVDVEYLNGSLKRFEYIATLSGSSRNTWEVLSFSKKASNAKPLPPRKP